MVKHRVLALLVIALSILAGYFVYNSQYSSSNTFKYKLGLDLSGGTHLVYQADISSLKAKDVGASMNALRDVIERRVNLFGVSEPLVQVEQSGVLGGNQQKLIVELPGVTDVNKAVELIGQTPTLEFRLVNESASKQLQPGASTSPEELAKIFVPTGLTGRLLQRAQLEFDGRTGEPLVTLQFNSEGSDLLAKITRENIGRQMAIFLDGNMLSSPTIREEITQGKAQISGNFTASDAQKLVRDLNYGALPVPITLVGTEKIGASLGENALKASVKAGIIAYIIIALFLISWYRLPGLIASLALAVYVVLNLLLFKILPGPLQITLTAAGIAGFILSIGMAVDANILIFERMKEELAKGKHLSDAMHEGFARAWTSIRDSNLSSMITAAVLYYFASTPIIKGFAVVFFLGVATSMFTAITISRTFLFAIAPKKEGKAIAFLFSKPKID